MPTVSFVERRIFSVEGFRVRIRHSGPGRQPGKDVRSDRADAPSYTFTRAAPADMTVAWWVDHRFTPLYPGWTVDVLDAGGVPVHGGTHLSTVRASYD